MTFVSDPVTISTSTELTPEVVQRAASSALELRRLVTHVAEIARPEEGWTRLLRVIANVAVADWMEGDLEVDFIGDDKGTTITFYAALGVGIRERLFAAQYVCVPIDEFQRAIVLDPRVAAPLRAHQDLNRLTLAAGERAGTREVLDFELEERAKGDGERPTAPPPAELEVDGTDVYTKPTIPPPSEQP